MEGRRIPAVTFKCRVDGEWTDVTTKDIFKNKRVVVFSLPGAFTPTCSSTHLPGYEAHYEEIKANGIDEVYCISVNDAFNTVEFKKHYVIVPNSEKYKLNLKRYIMIKKNSKKVKDEFVYNSKTNPEFLSLEEISKAIENNIKDIEY